MAQASLGVPLDPKDDCWIGPSGVTSLSIFSLESLRAVTITDVSMAVTNALLQAEAACAHTSVDTG